MSHTQKTPEIAIIGAGPGGLTLASILKTRNVHCTVYERDVSAAARTQGGTLDMHPETGRKALELAGLTSEFKKYCRNEGEDMRIFNQDGEVLLDEVKTDLTQADRPEIDRGDLRQILLDSLNPKSIKWNHALASIEAIPGTSRHTLHFKDGTTATADVVVAADGAWSRVRPLFTKLKPLYSGISYIEMHLTEVSKKHKEIAAMVGRGTLFAVGDNRGLIAQVNGKDTIRIYANFRCSEQWIKEVNFESKTHEEEQAVVLGLFPDWHESLLRLVKDADPGFLTRPLYELPVEALRWEHVPGVTMLGDAAHVMLPSGEGVNLAMLDAMELANAITETPEDVDAAIRKYEAVLFPRDEAKTVESKETAEMLLQTDGAKQLVAFFASHGPPPQAE